MTVVSVVYGLSPRVRGSPRWCRSRPLVVRSIPAGAGKPAPCHDYLLARWVYPRGCGEAENLEDGSMGDRFPNGSIPAGAGKPVTPCHPFQDAGLSPRVRGSPRTEAIGDLPVHGGLSPRVRGSPANDPSHHEPSRGLSPRVRGSPSPASCVVIGDGSIPAGAGKPCQGLRKTTT